MVSNPGYRGLTTHPNWVMMHSRQQFRGLPVSLSALHHCCGELAHRQKKKKQRKCSDPQLGPPVVPFLTLFWGEGSPTKIDYRF